MKQAVTPVKMSFRHELRDTDEFGLPVGILGLHPDRFYGAIGRVVLVCAVLEDQVITLRHTLAGAQQGTFTREPVSSQIKAARGLARNLPEQDAQATERFLDTGAEARQRRNKLVHSSFPAQPDGRLRGHRPTRDKSNTGGTADTVETSIEDRTLIQDLAQLVTSFNQAHALLGTYRRT